MHGADFSYPRSRDLVVDYVVISLVVLLPEMHEYAVSDRDAWSRISGRHGISREKAPASSVRNAAPPILVLGQIQ